MKGSPPCYAHRHSGKAQLREEHVLQGHHPGGCRDSELSIHHHQAEFRSGARLCGLPGQGLRHAMPPAHGVLQEAHALRPGAGDRRRWFGAGSARGEGHGQPVPALSYDPANDIRFLEEELDLWYLGLIEKGWERFARAMNQEKPQLHKAVAKQLSGLGVTEPMMEIVIEKLGRA